MSGPAVDLNRTRTAAISWIGRFVFRFRDYLTPLVAILVLVLVDPLPLFGDALADFWSDVLGVLVALCGQAIRVTVIGYAYIVRGGAEKQLAAPRLVREGFYSHSRNPMYLGNFLLLLGLAIIYNAPEVYLIGLPICIGGLLAIVRAEEEFLRARFGAEYEEYCRTVNRFFPDIHGLRATLARMRFDWRRVVRKEYGTTFAWTSAVVGFVALEQISWHGVEQSGALLAGLSAVWLAIVMGYVTVRRLKKTGRLNSPEFVPPS